MIIIEKSSLTVTQKHIQNLYYDYMHYCEECPKAYDFTCSGADARKCEKEKENMKKFFRNKII